MSESPGPRGHETGPDTETYLQCLHQQLRDARTRIIELDLIIETEESEIKARDERIKELEMLVYPFNAIGLADFIGPVKPCPFWGLVSLERDGFEEHIVCKNCGGSAPVGGWQFRSPIH